MLGLVSVVETIAQTPPVLCSNSYRAIPLRSSDADQGTCTLIRPASIPVPAMKPLSGTVTLGFTVSSTIVSVSTADQLPAASFHFT